MTRQGVLLLRLAGPLQSWGISSAYNRRDTAAEPTKSGVVGLLAAALGYERGADIRDLTALRLGVRADQPGTLLRDYHTAADYRGRPLLAAQTNKKGRQKLTAPAKPTQLTHRYYLQDAVFLVACQGPLPLLHQLDEAVRTPAFPLALGRRSCPPSRPIALGVQDSDGEQALENVLTTHLWEAGQPAREAHARRAARPGHIDLTATVEDTQGPLSVTDVPTSFHPLRRGLTERRIRQLPLTVPTGLPSSTDDADRAHHGPGHDPFALLGW